MKTKHLFAMPSSISFWLLSLSASFITSLLIVATYEDDIHRFYLKFYKSVFIHSEERRSHHLTSGRKYFLNPWIVASNAYESSLKILKVHASPKNDRDCANVLAASNQLLAISSKSATTDQLLLPYSISFTYNLKPGFISSMAQARASVVMLAASKCSTQAQMNEYRKRSKWLLKPVFTPVSEGGSLLSVDHNIWFQEYAQGIRILPTVLNGHLFTIESLSHIISLYPEYIPLYQKSLHSTCANVSKYDLSYWSLYDISHDDIAQSTIANVKYHKTHIRQLNDYAYLFPCSDDLRQLGKRFSAYLGSPINRIKWFAFSGFNKRLNIAYISLFTPAFVVLSILIRSVVRSRSRSNRSSQI